MRKVCKNLARNEPFFNVAPQLRSYKPLGEIKESSRLFGKEGGVRGDNQKESFKVSNTCRFGGDSIFAERVLGSSKHQRRARRSRMIVSEGWG